MNPLHPPAPDLGPLSPWAPELAQAFVTLASDIALVMDHNGLIRTVAQGTHGGTEAMVPAASEWVGRRWVDTVSADTRNKVDQLLSEVATTGQARRREINHPLDDQGTSVAVAYTAVRLGQTGPVLAVGRDLRAIGAIQQRFIEAQREMERGYWQVRQAEARYRLLFQVATDAVLLVDTEQHAIIEANPAAAELFGCALEQLTGHPMGHLVLHTYRQALEDLMATAVHSGQAAELRVRLLNRSSVASVAVTPLPIDDRQRLLVRVRTVDMPGSAAQLNATLARLVDSSSDGVLVTDSAGHVLLANPSFLRLVELSTERDVKGRVLTDWIDLPPQDITRLLQRVRIEGMAPRRPAQVLAANARTVPIELSATLLSEGDMECIGFTLHRIEDAATAPPAGGDALQAALAALDAQLGRVPLPELMRQAAGLLERHFIGLALEKSHEDAATAARMLGIPGDRIEGAPPAGASDPGDKRT